MSPTPNDVRPASGVDDAERAELEALRDEVARLRRFSSQASHDLKGPLATIVAAASTLAEQPNLPDAVRQELLAIVSRHALVAAEKLDELIGD